MIARRIKRLAPNLRPISQSLSSKPDPSMPHTITLIPSGRSFVAEGNEHVLDAALREGIALPYGCRNGTCVSCRGRVRAGRVAYPGERPHALAEAELEQGWTLLCQAMPASDLEVEIEEVRAALELPVRTLLARVAGKEQVAHDVTILHLRLPDGERLQFLSGQYVDILMRDGRRRSFSLANSPAGDEQLTVHVRHVPGGAFSGYVFEHLKERALLRIHGPLGSFFLREGSDRPLIFVAGGTGFAPIKSIIETALARGERRPMHLYWGVRARRDLYLHALASGWAVEHPQLVYVPVLSEPRPEDEWRGRTGLVHEAVLEDFPDLSPFEVYSSGPPAMVDAAWSTFGAHGLAPDRHFSDAFAHAYETGADLL